MVANSVAGDGIAANSLDANRIQADATLTQTLVVGGGQSLSDDQCERSDRRADPATRINANSTTIKPGQILIAGGTTLDDWRDVTEIRSRTIEAYSVKAESLKISGQSENFVIDSDFRPEGPNPCILTATIPASIPLLLWVIRPGEFRAAVQPTLNRFQQASPWLLLRRRRVQCSAY